MRRRPPRLAPAAWGLLAACTLNAAFMTLLAVGTGVLRLHEPDTPHAMILDLRRPPPPRRSPVPHEAEDGAKPSSQAPPRDRPPPIDPVSPTTAAASASEARRGVEPEPPRASGEDDAGLRAAAAVLRRLRDCAAVYSQNTGDASRCQLKRDLDTPTISGVSAERRIGFDAERQRAEDLIAVSRDLQSQTFQPEGSRAARFGCNLTHGKWRCGSY